MGQLNQAGASLVSDFGTEVSRGLYSGYSLQTKFGRNPGINTASAPEDMWNGGAEYTGFNATANENIEVFSADADDQGSLVSSGTATGGSNTTLIDSGATFITDGVAVGDIVLNDTKGVHGSIVSVDSETQVTVFDMVDGPGDDSQNASGDSYRIANANDTGAAVLRLSTLLDEDYVEQTPAYVILNGTTGVTVTGNYMRCSTGKVVLAGSSGLNEGQITVRQATTTANVFCVIPTFGRTTIGAFTVPAGKNCLIKGISFGIVRANGSAGSATMLLNAREVGGAWNARRAVELSTSTRYLEQSEGALFLNPGTDVKVTINSVSDNGTIADAEIEYYLINNT